MGKFMDEVNIRHEIEKKHPRKDSDTVLDLISLVSLFAWAFVPVDGPLKLLGFIAVFTWIVSRVSNYKQWDNEIKKKVQEKLDEKLDKK